MSTTIRGVRINLAAAICWENYMPLLRQALYAQNINLYLAPTADNRDAWLALMRTVAVEGRCFVVTSNMCQRDDSNPSTTTTTTNNTTAAAAAPPASRRRNSTITAEGHEIVLPAAGPGSSSSPSRRRRSVFDVDGNEIVLCDSTTPEPEPAQPSAAAAAPPTVNGHITPGRKTAGVAPGWLSRGGSAIVSPYGDVLAGPQWEDSEGLIWEDVDFRECIKGRLDLDVAGSYSRNDSFKFSVTGLKLDPLPY